MCLENLTPEEKYKQLKNIWSPPQTYKFPFQERKDGAVTKKRYATHLHLNTFSSWLCFSNSKQGYFCKSCVFFKPNIQLIKTQSSPSQLCTVPFTSFSKIDKLKDHEKSAYHSHTAAQMMSFISAMEKPSGDIAQISKKHMDEDARQNRFLILPIIELVHTMMKQNIAFRGHRDNEKSDSEDGNIGNFK